MDVSKKSVPISDIDVDAETGHVTPESLQELSSKLEEFGVQPLKMKKTISRKSSPKKKLSHEEMSEQAFNPCICHARVFKRKLHPGTNIEMYKVPGRLKQLLVCGIIPVQCSTKQADGSNLCAKHSRTDMFTDFTRCTKTNELFLGMYNEPIHEEPECVLMGNGFDNEVKKFVWDHNTDEKYDKYKTNPDAVVKSKSPKKEEKPKSLNSLKFYFFTNFPLDIIA